MSVTSFPLFERVARLPSSTPCERSVRQDTLYDFIRRVLAKRWLLRCEESLEMLMDVAK